MDSPQSPLTRESRYPAALVLGFASIGVLGFVASLVATLVSRLGATDYALSVGLSLGALMAAWIIDYRAQAGAPRARR